MRVFLGKWCSNFAPAVFVLSLCSCSPLPDRQIDAPECDYLAALQSVKQARQVYESDLHRSAPRSRLLESHHAVDVAQQREQDAEACEERARGRANLSAQWESARASASMLNIGRAQTILTVFEILGLIGTIAVGIWAVRATKAVSKQEISVLNEEHANASKRFESEIAETRIANKIALDSHKVSIGGRLTALNFGFEGEAQIEAERSPFVAFKLYNFGASEVVIIECHQTTVIVPPYPAAPEYDEPLAEFGYSLVRPTSQAGGPMTIRSGERLPALQTRSDSFLRGECRFLVYGKFVYRDIFDDIWEYGYAAENYMRLDEKLGPRFNWRDPKLPAFSYRRRRQT